MDKYALLAEALQSVEKIELIGEKIYFDDDYVGQIKEKTDTYLKFMYIPAMNDHPEGVEVKITLTGPVNWEELSEEIANDPPKS